MMKIIMILIISLFLFVGCSDTLNGTIKTANKVHNEIWDRLTKLESTVIVQQRQIDSLDIIIKKQIEESEKEKEKDM